VPDIAWFGPNGNEPDWENGYALAFLLDGHKENTGADKTDDSLFVIINADNLAATFRLPKPPGTTWSLEWTTQEKPPAWQDRRASARGRAPLVTTLASALTV
jgi:pullulanase/glycogen debranching enzyme